MATRNNVIIQQAQTHLTETQWRSVPFRAYVIAQGTCNDKSFEAILNCDPGLNSNASLYSDPNISFSKAEYQSIRRKLKTLVDVENAIDHRSEMPQGDWHSFFEMWDQTLFEKYNGVRQYLNVPKPEKDAAKALGAQWDPTHKQWYVHEKQVDMAHFERWLLPAQNTSERRSPE